MPISPEQARINGRKGGRPKGTKDPQTLDKQTAREVARQEITRHLIPLIRAHVVAAQGTIKLMLRAKDGTWRAATAADDIEKALNGDPDSYWFSPNQPNTGSLNTLLAYGLDKPREQQEIQVEGRIEIGWQGHQVPPLTIQAQPVTRELPSPADLGDVPDPD